MLTQHKIHSKKKKTKTKTKTSCKRTLKRVTRIHIFFLVCSTISNNSENDDIFEESSPQPLTTKTTSTFLRTQLTNTRNKLSEGKICFDGTFSYTELAKLIRDSSSLTSLGKKCDDFVTRRSITINQALKHAKDSKLDY